MSTEINPKCPNCQGKLTWKVRTVVLEQTMRGDIHSIGKIFKDSFLSYSPEEQEEMLQFDARLFYPLSDGSEDTDPM